MKVSLGTTRTFGSRCLARLAVVRCSSACPVQVPRVNDSLWSVPHHYYYVVPRLDVTMLRGSRPAGRNASGAVARVAAPRSHSPGGPAAGVVARKSFRYPVFCRQVASLRTVGSGRCEPASRFTRQVVVLLGSKRHRTKRCSRRIAAPSFVAASASGGRAAPAAERWRWAVT